MTSLPAAHFLVVSQPLFGHVRPLIGLCLNLLTAYPNLNITFLTAEAYSPKIQPEIDSHQVSPKVSTRLQVIAVKPGEGEFDQMDLLVGKDYKLGVPKALKEFFSGEKVFDAVKKEGVEVCKVTPKLLIADMFQNQISTMLAEIAANDPDTDDVIAELGYISFVPSGAANYIRHWGTEEQGGEYVGVGERKNQYVAEGMPEIPALLKAQQHITGKVIEIPGAVPMHDYEFCPQLDSFPLPPHVIPELIRAGEEARVADGAIFTFPEALEPGVWKIVEEMFGPDNKKTVMQVGPQLPQSLWEGKIPAALGEKDQEIIKFLDGIEAKHGKHSAVFISLGSIFWPMMRPDLIETVVETFIDQGVPVVFAMASPFANLSPELDAKIKSSDLIMTSPFAPQLAVLEHPATGWFLTHCGQGSVAESIICNVPVIAWPFNADQPQLAALLTHKFQLGIELMQVRNGPGVGKPTTRGVTPLGTKEGLVDELKSVSDMIKAGKDVEIYRANLKAFSDKVRESRKSGSAADHLKRFERWMTPDAVVERRMS